MNKWAYYTTFCWARYSKKLAQHVLAPKHLGALQKKDGKRLIIAEERDGDLSNVLELYLNVDEKEGVIEQAAFQAFGESALIGAADVICELAIGKNYMQAKRISYFLVDTHLRDRSGNEAFPEEVASHVNLALSALETAVEQCVDISLPEEYFETPLDLNALEKDGDYPDWEKLTENERLSLINKVIETDIKPYVELDAGGVFVTKLEEGPRVFIQYEGSCTSCFSATTSTLNAIQQILRAKAHPRIQVTPEL